MVALTPVIALQVGLMYAKVGKEAERWHRTPRKSMSF